MGFMLGMSSAEPSLKLHFLWLEMQPLYQDVKICDFVHVVFRTVFRVFSRPL
jgi:hypothetical protein